MDWQVLVNVRPLGSLGVFDPSSVIVQASDRVEAIAAATAKANALGWECDGVFACMQWR